MAISIAPFVLIKGRGTSVTSDIYTTVLAEVEREAAELTVTAVPRATKRVFRQPTAGNEAARQEKEEPESGHSEGTQDVPDQDAA
nr:hypothetical protein OH820_14610 [Streptomyces sp. NBC_00857]